MAAQRLLRPALQLSGQRFSPLAFRAAAIAPLSTQSTNNTPGQKAVRGKWLAAPPAPGKNMVGHYELCYRAKAAMELY
jgi:hypothetical protein